MRNGELSRSAHSGPDGAADAGFPPAPHRGALGRLRPPASVGPVTAHPCAAGGKDRAGAAAREELAWAARSTWLGERRRAACAPRARRRTRGPGLHHERRGVARSDEKPAWLPRMGHGKTAGLSNRGPHSGALCRGTAAAGLNTARLGAWGNGRKDFLGGSPPSFVFPETEAGARREYACAARSSCRGPTAGCPREPRRCRSPAPARGHGTGLREPGVPPRGPRTPAAVTPTCSHISHTNRSLRQVLIQFAAVSITTSQRFLVLSVATRMPSFGV